MGTNNKDSHFFQPCKCPRNASGNDVLLSGNVFKEKEHILNCPFLLPSGWRVDAMAGAPAASLNCEGEAALPGRQGSEGEGTWVPALDGPFSSLCLRNKETCLLFKPLLFWVSCHLQPKKKQTRILPDKIPEKKRTKAEKQGETRGGVRRMHRDLVRENVPTQLSLAHGLRPRVYPATARLLSHLHGLQQWPPSSSS